MSRWHGLIKNDPRYLAARIVCFERDDYACVDCGCEDDLQADHVVSLADLFASLALDEAIDAACDVDNLATRCGPCNRLKSSESHRSSGRTEWFNPKWSDVLTAGF